MLGVLRQWVILANVKTEKEASFPANQRFPWARVGMPLDLDGNLELELAQTRRETGEEWLSGLPASPAGPNYQSLEQNCLF